MEARELRILDQILTCLEKPSMRRTRSEVLKERENAIVGCCNRFADNMSCDCLETAAPDTASTDAKITPLTAQGRWQRMREFALNLTGLSKTNIDTWARHALETKDCKCPDCAKHSLFTNILDALEQWESRKNS